MARIQWPAHFMFGNSEAALLGPMGSPHTAQWLHARSNAAAAAHAAHGLARHNIAVPTFSRLRDIGSLHGFFTQNFRLGQ